MGKKSLANSNRHLGDATAYRLHVDAAVLPRPSIDAIKPTPVHATDVGGLESVIRVDFVDQFIQRSSQFRSFEAIHFRRINDATQIVQDMVARAGLELSFV